MLGEFVDPYVRAAVPRTRTAVPQRSSTSRRVRRVCRYTVRVVDVFAMPQSGTTVSVEAVDPVFQAEMASMLSQTGRCVSPSAWQRACKLPLASSHPSLCAATICRPEVVVGWYHSHPGFGCWLSATDVNTQQVGIGPAPSAQACVLPSLTACHVCGVLLLQSFEQLNDRSVAVVADPIQSVKGKVVIDAFRLINPQLLMLGQEPRQTTSNVGHLNRPSIQALIHGLNRHYYSIVISYRKNELEEKMLMNLHKKKWSKGLLLKDYERHSKDNEEVAKVRAPACCAAVQHCSRLRPLPLCSPVVACDLCRCAAL